MRNKVVYTPPDRIVKKEGEDIVGEFFNFFSNLNKKKSSLNNKIQKHGK